MFERLRRARRGVRGGAARSPLGGRSPPCGGSGAAPPKFFFVSDDIFPIKELGFWTNPGHWVKVLDAAGSYMYYIVL